jgi:hypothetical protein
MSIVPDTEDMEYKIPRGVAWRGVAWRAHSALDILQTLQNSGRGSSGSGSSQGLQRGSISMETKTRPGLDQQSPMAVPLIFDSDPRVEFDL